MTIPSDDHFSCNCDYCEQKIADNRTKRAKEIRNRDLPLRDQLVAETFDGELDIRTAYRAMITIRNHLNREIDAGAKLDPIEEVTELLFKAKSLLEEIEGVVP